VEIEGGLRIDLFREGYRVGKVNIQSMRLLQAVRIFHGKAVTEVLQMLPLLYHVCGVAQASAAVTACEQAMAIQPSEASRRAREMLVMMETTREHLWRILMDWAHITGHEKDKAVIVQMQKFIPRLKYALFADSNGFVPGAQATVNTKAVRSIIDELQQLLEQAVFAMPADQWLECSDKQALQHWLDTADTGAAKMLKQVFLKDQGVGSDTTVGFLPELDENMLHQRLMQEDADAFVAQPLWQGKPYETSVLCRQRHQPLVAALLESDGNGVVTRTVARLVELAGVSVTLERLLQELLPEVSRQRLSPPRTRNSNTSEQHSGVGLGQVEAARGRLVHRVDMEDGIVRRYQILAPTEWNFHPQGIAAQLLQNLPARDKNVLNRQADWVINAIDPCVRYEVMVH